jgi:hypothetical protein
VPSHRLDESIICTGARAPQVTSQSAVDVNMHQRNSFLTRQTHPPSAASTPHPPGRIDRHQVRDGRLSSTSLFFFLFLFCLMIPVEADTETFSSARLMRFTLACPLVITAAPVCTVFRCISHYCQCPGIIATCYYPQQLTWPPPPRPERTRQAPPPSFLNSRHRP